MAWGTFMVLKLNFFIKRKSQIKIADHNGTVWSATINGLVFAYQQVKLLLNVFIYNMFLFIFQIISNAFFP